MNNLLASLAGAAKGKSPKKKVVLLEENAAQDGKALSSAIAKFIVTKEKPDTEVKSGTRASG